MIDPNDRVTIKEKYIKTPAGLVIRCWTADDWQTYTVEETAFTDVPVVADWNNYCWPVDEVKS